MATQKMLVKTPTPAQDAHGIKIPVVDLDKYIKRLQDVESTQEYWNENNIPCMITRLRKIYYGRPEWKRVVIKDAPNSCAPPEKKKSAYIKLKNAQIVRLADGHILDIGHVFAALDALQYPQAGGISLLNKDLWKYARDKVLPDGWKIGDLIDHFTSRGFPVKIHSNAAFATWLGDLGDALKGKLYDPKNKQKAHDEGSPGEDMLGNIDGYVIYHQYVAAPKKNRRLKTVSAILKDYYGNPKYKAPTEPERYRQFARAIGLRWNGHEFKDKDKEDWIDKYKDQLRAAAILCIGEFSKNTITTPQKFFAGLDVLLNQTGKTELELLLTALKKLL